MQHSVCFNRLSHAGSARLTYFTCSTPDKINVNYLDLYYTLCYSVDDQEWVKKELIDFLESEGHGYSLCFHPRDFAPTVTIHKNISTAIKHSRRMISVVTRYGPWSHDV